MGRAAPRMGHQLPERFANTEWVAPSCAEEQASLAAGAPAEVIAALRPTLGAERADRLDAVAAARLGDRMYEFMDRLITVALPRVRDFRGISDNSFDGRGNYTLGITEQIIFPEIDLDKINKIAGMDITFVTTAKTDAEAFELLKQMGMPFKNQKN